MTLARVALIAVLLAPATARAQSAGAALADPTTGAPALGVVPPPPGYGVTIAPATAPTDAPGVPAPRARAGGYMPTWPLLVPGLAAFVVSYGTAAFAGAIVLSGGPSDQAGWLFAPIVGPFVLAADATGPDDVALFIALGVAEAAGIALMIAGLAINRRAAPSEDAVSFVPILGPELAGLSARGRF